MTGMTVENNPVADYPPSWDRIYPRCPVCRSEQYALAVLAFSRGEHGCWNCHHVIREDARLAPEEKPHGHQDCPDGPAAHEDYCLNGRQE